MSPAKVLIEGMKVVANGGIWALGYQIVSHLYERVIRRGK